MSRSEAYVRRVNYYETDRMGIVHHSNYIRWIEEARTEYMRLNGVDYAQVEAAGILMPVTGVDCEYKQSARYGDVVVIETSLSFFNGIRAAFDYRIHFEGKDETVAKAQTRHCFIDEHKRIPLNLIKKLPETSRIMSVLAEKTELR